MYSFYFSLVVLGLREAEVSNRRTRRWINDRLLMELVPRLNAEEIRGLFAPPPWGKRYWIETHLIVFVYVFKFSSSLNGYLLQFEDSKFLFLTKAVTEDKIKEVISEDYKERSEETYDIYLLPPGEDPEACQSYLRMRNRDGKYNLMFEEWVTDSPFIISPRITFEVSFRLLGGLMALGCTIVTILKRSSHIFSDDRVVEAERDLARDFQPLPFHYVEIARLLFDHAHASSVLVIGIFIVAYKLDSPEMIQDA
ncbi:hypothetical protein POM88_047937 [Heracleum sosnowskyi]|uniref:CYTH domain-containing protein n=1 Tax=Heracleum sosnowskyi TaxID=360622 RepID=A0AAD8GU60_9APIA|nr:hypothetical protein POM88_047937 [Heracleum sosnowskyi]